MAVAPHYANLFGNADLWDEPNPDYAAAVGAYEGAGDFHAALSIVSNLPQRSPVCFAMKLSTEGTSIVVGHSLTRFPAVPGTVNAVDEKAIVLIGNVDATVIGITLPDDAWRRTGVHRCEAPVDILATVAGGTLQPIAAAADGDELNHRRVMLIPPALNNAVLTSQASGVYGPADFFNRFIQPELASGEADRIATIRPLAEWWRLACTEDAGGCLCEVDPVTPAGLAQTGAFNQWVNRTRHLSMSRLGAVGPGLTTAAFQAGVTTLADRMTETTQAHIDFERARGQKTFADKHGIPLSDRIHNWCGVVDDAGLPDVHMLMVNADKGRQYGILNGLLVARTQESPVGLNVDTAPIPTTQLVEQCYRNYRPGGTGLSFGHGLSPFAVVCEGHADAHALRLATNRASLAHGSTSVSLADAEALTTSDLKFPTLPYMAVEKIYGWSIHVDIYHGPNQPISNNIREAVMSVGPSFFRIASLMSDNHSAMDLICRIMYDMQQEYFHWLSQSEQAIGTGRPPAVPNFRNLVTIVQTYRADSLSPLPLPWYSLVSAPARAGSRKSEDKPSTREALGMVSAVNPRVDPKIKSRWENSGHASLSAMLAGKEYTIPKHGGKDVCLSWGIKGICNSTCKRKDTHVPYSGTVIKKLGELLDACGVAGGAN